MKDTPCILIVDDQQSEVALISELLKSAGMQTTVVGDGFKALAACKVRTPDVVLLDLEMPLMSGMEVLNRLTAEEKTRNIAVIFMRPAAGQYNINKEYEDFPVMAKPLEPQDVLSMVKTVLREKALKDELRKKEGQVKELALTDPVTQCRNGRYLTEFLKTELAQCLRYKHALAIVSLEIDNHKELAKAHGAKGLDSILAQLAVILERGNRRADLLARTGPAEFVLALPFTNADGAVEVAERKRTAVEESTFTVPDGNTARLTVSLGISQFKQDMDTTGEMLLSYARAAMTQAGEAGGNQTFMAE